VSNNEIHPTGKQASFMFRPFLKIPPMQFYLWRRIAEILIKTVGAFLNP
jgi:hypothetical protein